MCFRKNTVSYFVWLIFIMCNCIVFSFLGTMCARVFTDSFFMAGIGVVAAFFGLLFIIYLMTGFLASAAAQEKRDRKKNRPKEMDEGRSAVKKQLILEGIAVVILFALGIGIRIYLLPEAGETAAYYDVAKVSRDTETLIVPVQNSVYYYLFLLRGLFLVAGNHWIAGIWLQIFLQILAAVILYFGVRKMGGVFPAVGMLGYMMFSPVQIWAGLNYSPQMLYLVLWSVGLLYLVFYLNASRKEGEKETPGYSILMWLGVLAAGIVVGFLGYVDVSGFILIFLPMLLPMVYRESKKKGIWIGRMLLGVLAVPGTFFGCIYLDGLFSNAAFRGVLQAWITTFSFEMPNVVALLQQSSIEVMVLLVLMAFHVFSFYRRKDTEVITPWILMTFSLAGLYVTGIASASMNGRELLFLLMSVSAGIGIRELFAVKMPAENAAGELPASGKKVGEKSAVTEPALEKPRFLENPLPLPKKHIKKTMDYAFVPEAGQMKYDVDVKETDDFDL